MNKKIFALCLLLSLVVGCAPTKPKDFSADVILKAKGISQKSKFYFSNNKWRIDSNVMGQKSAVIFRQDKNLTWFLMPAQKMYMEQKLTKQQSLGVTNKVPGETKREKLGQETVNGVACTKYKITYKNNADQKENSISQWISQDNIVIRSQAEDKSWVMDYKNIKYAPQPAQLFELPKDYGKFKLPY